MTPAIHTSSRASAPRLIAIVAVGALLLAACGGGDAPEADESPADVQSPAVETETDTPPADEAEDEAEDEAAGEAAFTGPQQPARVTYAFEEGDMPEGMSEFVLSFDPPRSALIYEQGRFIDTGEGEAIVCTTESGEAQCFVMPRGQQSQFVTGFFGSFFGIIEGFGEAVDTPGFNRTGTREVAGRQATCATFDPAAMSAQTGVEVEDVQDAEVCVDQETGIGLWYSVTQGGESSTVVAVEFGDPQPDDFTPPAEPQDFSGQGG